MHKKEKKLSEKLTTAFIIIFLFVCSILIIIFSADLVNLPEQISKEEQANLAFSNFYTDNRLDYESDEVFSNFRPLKGGNLKEDYIYRGASPYIPGQRSIYVNKFLEKNNIRNVISLSDDNKTIKEYINNQNIENLYFAQNYYSGSLSDFALNYENDDIWNERDIKKLIQALKFINKSDGNIYIHCLIGRDRTGVFCLILECLSDFTYEEMLEDYMKSFKNLSYINKDDFPEQYNYWKNNGIDNMLNKIQEFSHTKENSKLSYKEKTIKMLKNYGMKETDIEQLINKICN